MSDPDVLALLCEHLSVLAPTTTDLPDDFAARRLPIVQVAELPSRPAAQPWNGPAVLDRIDVDVDVFAAGLETVADLARFGDPNLRDLLAAWSTQRVTTVALTVPTRRPDYNPAVQRYGCVLSVLVRR